MMCGPTVADKASLEKPVAACEAYLYKSAAVYESK